MSAVEDMLEKARAVGRAKAQKDVALKLIKLGHHTLEDIAKVCNLTLQQVQNLADSLKS